GTVWGIGTATRYRGNDLRSRRLVSGPQRIALADRLADAAMRHFHRMHALNKLAMRGADGRALVASSCVLLTTLRNALKLLIFPMRLRRAGGQSRASSTTSGRVSASDLRPPILPLTSRA